MGSNLSFGKIAVWRMKCRAKEESRTPVEVQEGMLVRDKAMEVMLERRKEIRHTFWKQNRLLADELAAGQEEGLKKREESQVAPNSGLRNSVDDSATYWGGGEWRRNGFGKTSDFVRDMAGLRCLCNIHLETPSRRSNAGDEPYRGCKLGTVGTEGVFKGMGMDENLGRSLELLEHFSIPAPPRCQNSKPILFF